ncbi:MAG: hypothetical protein WC582_02425 [Patescibacteria group bacterium]
MSQARAAILSGESADECRTICQWHIGRQPWTSELFGTCLPAGRGKRAR